MCFEAFKHEIDDSGYMRNIKFIVGIGSASSNADTKRVVLSLV